MHSLTLWSLSCLLWTAAPDTAVVCDAQLRPTMEKWVEYRQRQGHRMVWIDSAADPHLIRQRIIQRAKQTPLRYVLLVGDHRGPFVVPAFHAPARVILDWGSETTIATDMPYGDLDGDQIPELAVGRFCVDNATQLRWQIEKTIAFEQTPGTWRRNLHFIAGVSGISPLVDQAIETAVKRLLTQSIPNDFQTTMTRANWRSPFCPDPRQITETTLTRLNEGGLFWVYMGHGHWNHLDWLQAPKDRYLILAKEDVVRANYRQAPAIAVFLSCYAGAMDAEESIVEELVRAPRGPVAAIAASRVSMPYGISIFSTGLMDGYFRNRSPTLGAAFLSGQQRLASKQLPARIRWIKWLAKVASPKPELLDAEQAEHLRLFNLFGDPLLRLPLAESAELVAVKTISADAPLSVAITVPFAGKGRLILTKPLDQLPGPAKARKVYPQTEADFRKFSAEYRRVNDRILHERSIEFPKAGTYQLEPAFTIPKSVNGKCQLVLYLENPQGQFATATSAIVVKSFADDSHPQPQAP